ncbi:hypothetical protein ACLOJK_038193 [Asimina triloba]
MEVRLLLRTARGYEVDLAGSWPVLRWVSTHLHWSLADRAGHGERVDEGRYASSPGCCGRTPAPMEDGRRSLLVLSAMEDEQLVVHHCYPLKKTKEMWMGWIDGTTCGWRDRQLRLADGGFAGKPIAGSHGCRLEEDDGAPNPVLRRCAEDHVPAMCNLQFRP